MAKSLISLGANLDRPEVAMVEAARRLKRFSSHCSARFSRVYESIAVGGPPGQGTFLNAVALIDTDQDVLGLLRTLHQWESELGRTRDVRWGPRNIDLDLLLYEDFICNSVELTLPHPRMTFRRFVLQPSCDIAAQMVHPITKKPLEQLLEQLNGEHNFVAVLGGSQEDRASLMAGVQAKLTEQGIEIEAISSDHNTKPGKSSPHRFDGIPPDEINLRSTQWLISDGWIPPERRRSEKNGIEAAPKLLILFESSTPSASLENMQSTSFTCPFLVIDSKSSEKQAADEVTAAILAISLLPVPTSLSLSEALGD